MDDLRMLGDLGRSLEHEPPASLARQRARLLDAAARPRGRGLRGRWTLLGVVAAVTAAAILVPATVLHGRDAKPVATETTTAAAGEALNVLLIGSDERRGGAARSDTLMLVHVPADRKNIRVVSFPRTLLVTIPGCENARGKDAPERLGLINSAYSSGGAACTLKTVESLTRVQIDQTVVIGFDAFRKMVDALGGVEMTLPKPAADRKAGLDLPAGTHTLNGTQALAFVRSRAMGGGSDAERMKRQRAFMMALVREAKEQRRANPVRFAKFLAVVAGSVEAEPGLAVGRLQTLAAGFVKTGALDVEFNVLPVRPAPSDPNRLVWDEVPAERLFAPFRE